MYCLLKLKCEFSMSTLFLYLVRYVGIVNYPEIHLPPPTIALLRTISNSIYN